MAQVNYTRGVNLVLKVGNDESPEVFTPLCTINAQRGISFSANVREETVPDCDNPDLPGWILREAESFSMAFEGGGMLHKPNVKAMWDWKGLSKTCQVVLHDDDPANVITFEGRFILTEFEVTGEAAGKAQATLRLASDGEITGDFGVNVGGS